MARVRLLEPVGFRLLPWEPRRGERKLLLLS
jgi:hypothetical protein